jgi:hypothetical protein
MKTTNQTLLVDKYRLLTKAPNGKFDSNGEKELILNSEKENENQPFEVTEQQYKDVVKGASKTGETFIIRKAITDSESVSDLEGKPRKQSNKK